MVRFGSISKSRHVLLYNFFTLRSWRVLDWETSDYITPLYFSAVSTVTLGKIRTKRNAESSAIRYHNFDWSMAILLSC